MERASNQPEGSKVILIKQNQSVYVEIPPPGWKSKLHMHFPVEIRMNAVVFSGNVLERKMLNVDDGFNAESYGLPMALLLVWLGGWTTALSMLVSLLIREGE